MIDLSCSSQAQSLAPMLGMQLDVEEVEGIEPERPSKRVKQPHDDWAITCLRRLQQSNLPAFNRAREKLQHVSGCKISTDLQRKR